MDVSSLDVWICSVYRYFLGTVLRKVNQGLNLTVSGLVSDWMRITPCVLAMSDVRDIHGVVVDFSHS